MLTVVGQNIVVIDANDLSIQVTASGDANIIAEQRLEVKAGGNALGGQTIDGALDAESRNAFVHVGDGDANTMTIGNGAIVTGATMAGLRADVTGNVSVTGPDGAVFLGTTTGDLDVAASDGSAYVDGQPSPTGGDRADIGGNLTVTALDRILVDADAVGGTVTLTETAGDVDGSPDRILANIDTIGGVATVTAANGNADLIAATSIGGDLTVEALNGDARVGVGSFTGDTVDVEWQNGEVVATGDPGNASIIELQIGPADLTGGVGNPDDVVVAGEFLNFNVDVEAEFGVVLGGGIAIAGDTGAVDFDTGTPVPSRPAGLGGTESIAVLGGTGGPDVLVVDREVGAVDDSFGYLAVIADRGSYTPDPASLRILGDRDGSAVAGRDILQADDVLVAGDSLFDTNGISDVILANTDNNFGGYYDDPLNGPYDPMVPIGRVHVHGENVRITDATDIHFGAVAADRFEVTTADDGSVFFRQILGLDRAETRVIRDGTLVGGEGLVGDVIINSGDDVVIGVLEDPTDPDGPNFDPLLSAPGEPGFREDIFYVNNLTVDRAPGRVILPRTAATNADFDNNLSYYGVNISDTFRYAGPHQEIDLTGFLTVTRTRAAAMLPQGPRSANYRFNNCVIGDLNDCGLPLAPVDIMTRITVPPNLFELDRDQLDLLYVPIGNEEIWGVPTEVLYNLDHQVNMGAFDTMAMGPWTIYFGFDQANIPAGERGAVEEAAAAAAAMGDSPVVVSGHTDTSGPAQYNLDLSARRAQSAVNILNSQGIDSSRINVSATGEEELAVPTADGVREPRNRRVEVRVLK